MNPDFVMKKDINIWTKSHTKLYKFASFKYSKKCQNSLLSKNVPKNPVSQCGHSPKWYELCCICVFVSIEIHIWTRTHKYRNTHICKHTTRDRVRADAGLTDMITGRPHGFGVGTPCVLFLTTPLHNGFWQEFCKIINDYISLGSPCVLFLTTPHNGFGWSFVRVEDNFSK